MASQLLAIKNLAIAVTMPTVARVLAGWAMVVAMVILEAIPRSRVEWAMAVAEWAMALAG